MAPTPKRARTEPSLPTATGAPKITLSGGEAHHSSLVALWRQDKLTDIAVCAEGVEFKAHRAVLAASSGYFLSLFDSGMRDAETATHAIEGLRSSVLETLLAFVYEGSCQVEEGLLTEMLDASARLVVDPLKAACARAIQSQLGPCNALDVWRLADLYTLPVLEKAAVDSALRGFEELPLQSASGAQVVALVQEDRLVAKNEEAVFQWCVRWWEAAERPEAELLAVMRHVRFAAMAEGFLRETVRAWPALDSRDGRDLLFDAMLPLVGGTKLVPRSGFGPCLIYVVGGKDEGVRLSTVDMYDPQNASWTQVASMTGPRASHGCVVLDGKLYVVGGDGPSFQVLDTAEVYDPQTDGWQPLAKMTTARAAFGLVAVGGKIYAIGGWDGASELESVEAYDPQLGAWALVASMSGKRMQHASVALDGKIYTMGGFADGVGTLDTVTVYDPQADSWQQVASMPQGRTAHAAAAMGDKIYVTGGESQMNSVNSAYVYDSKVNAWTQLASMGVRRRLHASAAVGSKLYVFGGRSNAGETLNSVEIYHPASDRWGQGPSFITARESMLAVSDC